MSSQNVLNVPPQFIPATIGDLLNCAVTSLAGPVGFTLTQPYIVLNHIHVVNISGAAVTLSLFKGASGGSTAGTQYAGAAASSIAAAGGVFSYYGDGDRFDATTFLTGIASSANALVITIDAEIYVE